jgi:hypothetical protein
MCIPWFVCSAHQNTRGDIAVLCTAHHCTTTSKKGAAPLTSNQWHGGCKRPLCCYLATYYASWLRFGRLLKDGQATAQQRTSYSAVLQAPVTNVPSSYVQLCRLILCLSRGPKPKGECHLVTNSLPGSAVYAAPVCLAHACRSNSPSSRSPPALD